MNSKLSYALKYTGVVFLIFIFPSLLVVLSHSYNGYLWQNESISIPGLPVTALLWWGLLYFWHSRLTERKRLANFLDSLTSLSGNQFEEVIRNTGNYPETWSEKDRNDATRKSLFEAVLKKH